MISPKITIVTPSYNQGCFLQETIDSVVSQGYKNLEYIVIDGGSKDNSVEIIKKNSKWLTYWVSEPDHGQSDAIEKGFAKATGRILGWINSDDLLLPNSLKTIAEHFSKNVDHHFIHGTCLLIDQNGNHVLNTDAPDGVRRMTWSLKDSFRNWPKYWFAQQSTFWTAEIWKKCGGLNRNLHYAMDLDLWYRFSHSVELHFLQETLAAYRIHQSAKCYHDFLPAIIENMMLTGKNGSDEVRQFWDIYSPTISTLLDENRSLKSEIRHQMNVVSQYRSSRTFRIMNSFRKFLNLFRT